MGPSEERGDDETHWNDIFGALSVCASTVNEQLSERSVPTAAASTLSGLAMLLKGAAGAARELQASQAGRVQAHREALGEALGVVAALREVVAQQRAALISSRAPAAAQKSQSPKPQSPATPTMAASTQTCLTIADLGDLDVEPATAELSAEPSAEHSAEPPTEPSTEPTWRVTNRPLAVARERIAALEAQVATGVEGLRVQDAMTRVLQGRADRLATELAAAERGLRAQTARGVALQRVIVSLESIAATQGALLGATPAPRTAPRLRASAESFRSDNSLLRRSVGFADWGDAARNGGYGDGDGDGDDDGSDGDGTGSHDDCNGRSGWDRDKREQGGAD
jgi:hypothetical protein